MLLEPPDCSTYPLTPCTERDWQQCDWCGGLVCSVHAVVYPVFHSTSDEFPGIDMMCGWCVRECYRLGEIMASEHGYEYINRR